MPALHKHLGGLLGFLDLERIGFNYFLWGACVLAFVFSFERKLKAVCESIFRLVENLDML